MLCIGVDRKSGGSVTLSVQSWVSCGAGVRATSRADRSEGAFGRLPTKNQRNANGIGIAGGDNHRHHAVPESTVLMGSDRDLRPPALSVVVPFFNEEGNVLRLVSEVDNVLGGTHYELVAVNDGSVDATGSELAQTARVYPKLRIVQLAGNHGQSAAIVAGVVAARGDLVATLDGDGQNPPSDIPRLVKVYEKAFLETPERPVLVVGWRQKRNDGWTRRLSSQLAYRVRNRVLGDECPDTGCGLKVFGRQQFLCLPLFRNMHRFLPALFLRNAGQVICIPVAHRPRRVGQSKYGMGNRLMTGLVDMLGVYWLLRRGCRIEPGDQ